MGSLRKFVFPAIICHYSQTAAALSHPGPKILGMIHIPALPGTPHNTLNIEDIIRKAVNDAEIYKKYRLDGVVVENMHDLPYLRDVGVETVAYMSVICGVVRQRLDDVIRGGDDVTRGGDDVIRGGDDVIRGGDDVIRGGDDVMTCGVQVLSGGHMQALAVAAATGLDFIRCECFVFSHVADEGWMDACAGPLLRYRRSLGATRVKVYTDVEKKHSSHQVTSDLTITDKAAAAEFFLSDGVIVTGSRTGEAARAAEVAEIKGHVSVPVLVGSGVTRENVHEYWLADGVIVGSHFKIGGHWAHEVDENRVKLFMERVRELRGKEDKI